MMTFGVSFDGFAPISETLETAKLAEACGARSFWVAEHLGFRESFLTSLALVQATREARVFPTSVSPYLRHPMPTAMGLASIAELAPGRAGIAIGVGNPMFLKESGIVIDRPIKAIRDYVDAMRDLLTGEPVTRTGLTYALNGARLAFVPQTKPAIYIAPMGPQMLKLSGEIADGLVLSAGLSTPYVAQSLAKAAEGTQKAGRDPASVRKAAYVYCIAGGEAKARTDKVRQKLAFLFRNESIGDNIRASGLPIDHEAIMAAVAQRDLQKAASLVPDEAVEAFAIAGDTAACRRAVDAYERAGLEEIVLSLVGTAEDRARTLDIIKSL